MHPVVKGDAYGHGAIPVARALRGAGADGLCVATFDEALAIRAAGIDGPLVVLYPIPAGLGPLARQERVGVSTGDATLLRALLGSIGEGDGPPLDVQLDVETGLGRAGLTGAELIEAARTIQANPSARLAGVWSHLQAPEDGERTAAQLRRFEEAVVALGAAGVTLPPRHVAASGGLVLDGVAALDGVRPGLAMYGLIPDELLHGPAGLRPDVRGGARGLRPALSLHARPVRVAELPAGTGISYGPTFTTSRPSRIASLPIGYGDGWSRALSNRAGAIVRGMRVPLVGNVAMDAVMADVTDVPGGPVSVDDEFVLIGSQGDLRITAAEVAEARGTNSWEVVTTLAVRLPRVYHAASVLQDMRTLVAYEVGGRRSMRP